MKKIALLALAGLLLPTSPLGAAVPTGPLKLAIEKTVRDSLRDPEAARFEHLNYRGGDIYCGYVNGKNAYGGYTGKRMFAVMVLDKAKSIIGLISVDEGNGTTEEFCRKTGGI